jgi:hypothetical protein
MQLSEEQLKNDLNNLNVKKEQCVQQFHQIVGAISIIEQMIERLNHKDEKLDNINGDLSSSENETVDA